MAVMATAAAGAIPSITAGRGYYWGWDDPFWLAATATASIRSYTYYVSELDLDIRRKVDNASLFEGKAKARSRTDELARTVPSLVEAMFTGFPGQFGRNDQDHGPARSAAGKASY